MSYSRYSRFFCDCGAGGVRGIICKALKGKHKAELTSGPPPVTYTSALASLKSNILSIDQINGTEEKKRNSLPDADSGLLQLSPALKMSLVVQLKNESLLLSLLHLFDTMLNLTKVKLNQVPISLPDAEDIGAKEKDFVSVNNLFENVQTFKSNIFATRFKFNGRSGREIKNLLSSQSIIRQALAFNSKSKMAIVEGDLGITIIDPMRLFESGGNSTLDKRSFKVLCKTPMPYEVMGIAFNPVYESYLLAYGYKECRILTLNPKMEIIDQLEINLSLEALDNQSYIIKSMWVPGSLTNVSVVTNHSVKLYDLSKDNICPLHNFSVPTSQTIKDTVICSDSGILTLVVLCNSGTLYVQSLDFSFSTSSNGPQQLETVLSVPEEYASLEGESLAYSSQRKMLFVSFKQDKTFVAQFDKKKQSLANIISLVDSSSNSTLPPSLSLWSEVGEFPDNMMIALGKKGNLVAVNVKKNQVQYQVLKFPKNLTKIESFTTWNHSLKGPSIATLLEDGSIALFTNSQINSPLPVPGKVSQVEDEPVDIAELIKHVGKKFFAKQKKFFYF